jgi:hypothetical protein
MVRKTSFSKLLGYAPYTERRPGVRHSVKKNLDARMQVTRRGRWMFKKGDRAIIGRDSCREERGAGARRGSWRRVQSRVGGAQRGRMVRVLGRLLTICGHTGGLSIFLGRRTRASGTGLACVCGQAVVKFSLPFEQ